MKYVKTKDGIKTSNKVTHELIKDISDAGYFTTLKKGSYVTIGKEWFNFYGRWIDIIDESGRHYSIRPDEVKRVTKELPQADTIKELIDEYVAIYPEYPHLNNIIDSEYFFSHESSEGEYEYYGSIWINGNLIKVAKKNEKGELELL